MINKLNGVLLPGAITLPKDYNSSGISARSTKGGSPLLITEYAKAADQLFELAIAKFNQGVYFPVWATCLSFQKMVTYFLGNTVDWQSSCDVVDVSLNLDFPSGIPKTRLYKDAPENIIDILVNKNVTPNYHRICLEVDTFYANKNLSGECAFVSRAKHWLSK